MHKTTSLFMQLRDISGTNDKISFVRDHGTDPEFSCTLRFLLDTGIVTGISEKKWEKPYIQQYVSSIELGDILNYAATHNTGRDTDLSWLHNASDSWCTDDTDRTFLKGLITKNLPLGIDVKGVNKAIPGLVPVFDVMLANSLFKLSEKQLSALTNNFTREFVIEPKLDGFRCIVIKQGDSATFISRQGKLFEGLVDIEAELRRLPGDFVLDSEIIISDRKRFPSKDQYKQTSKIVTQKDVEKHGVTINVFDCLTLEEWQTKHCGRPWNARYEDLIKLLSNYTNSDKKPIYAVPVLYRGTDIEQAYNLLAKAREDNEEGVMLRFTDTPYQFKRSNDLLKLKVMNEIDAYIIGYMEGTNKNVGTLGSFLCRVTHPQYGELEFKVGSGYTDEERDLYWGARDSLVGRVMEVQYFEVTKNTSDNTFSVRFPVHKCIKDEGAEPNN